jgi:hypothetical protein
MVRVTEVEIRVLIREVSARAARGGGMDRETYDALSAASALLADLAFRPGESELALVRDRLTACGAPLARAA